jgi:hypothetical protein
MAKVYVTMEWEINIPNDLTDDKEILEYLQETFDNGTMLDDDADITGWSWDDEPIYTD